MSYNFNEIIDRKNSNAISVDGFRDFILKDNPNAELSYEDDHLIKMWVADMQIASPEVVIRAIRNRLDGRIFGYTRIFDPAYYESFAAWAKARYNWHFKEDDLQISNGVVPALYELIDYICKPDEKILFVTPSYGPFKNAVEHNNREYVCSALANNDGYFTIDFSDFEAKASDEKTVLCIFCNPHNPTGRAWNEEELKKVGDICIRHNLWIISDEIHCDLLRVGRKHIPMAAVHPDYDRIITCMAASKTFNIAGLMISNIIIPNQALKETWQKRYSSLQNPLSVVAAQAAYTHGADWLDNLRVHLDDNFHFTANYLAENLPDAGFRIPEATYLAWIDLTSYLPDEDNLPLYFAKKAGVILEGGNMFVGNANGFIRLLMACPRSVLEEALRRISNALTKC